jgi:hypothetical protein
MERIAPGPAALEQARVTGLDVCLEQRELLDDPAARVENDEVFVDLPVLADQAMIGLSELDGAVAQTVRGHVNETLVIQIEPMVGIELVLPQELAVLVEPGDADSERKGLVPPKRHQEVPVVVHVRADRNEVLWPRRAAQGLPHGTDGSIGQT